MTRIPKNRLAARLALLAALILTMQYLRSPAKAYAVTCEQCATILDSCVDSCGGDKTCIHECQEDYLACLEVCT
jgi:hypothetical protein